MLETTWSLSSTTRSLTLEEPVSTTSTFTEVSPTPGALQAGEDAEGGGAVPGDDQHRRRGGGHGLGEVLVEDAHPLPCVRVG
jgi:hypothetical protein